MTDVHDDIDVRARTSGRPGVYETTASAVFAIGFLTIAGAWFFELVLGLQPCPLCLTQRIPYYIGVPIAGLLAFIAWEGLRWQGNPTLRDAWVRARGFVLRGGLALLAVVFGVSAGIGVYHAGVEWSLWSGPLGCSGVDTVPGSVDALMSALEDDVRVVACDTAPWVFLGLSLAGWNALISAALAGLALYGALSRPAAFRPEQPFYY